MLDIEKVTASLRECVAAGTFCVEVLLRATIREMKSGELLYDKVLAYTSEYPPGRVTKNRDRLYHVRTNDVAPCRAMTAYCDGDSAELVKAEISNAVRSIARRIASDLGFVPKQSEKRGL